MPAHPASIIYLHEPPAAYYARINPPPPPRKATTRVVHMIRGACAKGLAKFKRTAAEFKAEFKAKFKSSSSAASTAAAAAAAAAASPAVEEGRVTCESWETESFYSDY